MEGRLSNLVNGPSIVAGILEFRCELLNPDIRDAEYKCNGLTGLQ